jgi:hypothetical protein
MSGTLVEKLETLYYPTGGGTLGAARIAAIGEAIAIVRQHEAEQMLELVERVAIAICPWYAGGKDSEPDPAKVWMTMDSRLQNAYREQAKAAVAAMGMQQRKGQ